MNYGKENNNWAQKEYKQEAGLLKNHTKKPTTAKNQKDISQIRNQQSLNKLENY